MAKTKYAAVFLLSRMGWIIGLAAVFYFLSQNPLFLSHSVTELPLRAVLGVAIFSSLGNMCQGIRFYFLWPDGKLPFWKATFLPFCMHSANIMLPFRGGETIQPLFVHKWNPSQKLKSLFFWLLIDKLIEFVAMLPFLVVTAFVFHYRLPQAIALWVLLAASFFAWCWRTKNRPRRLALAYFFATLSWVFNFAVFYSLMNSVPVALGLLIGTSVGSAIPGLPAAIGTYEYAFVWVCQKAGFVSPHTPVLAIASHSVSIVTTLLIGVSLGFVWGWPSRKDRIEAQAQAIPLGQQISNLFVYTGGVLTLFFSGVLWIPQQERAKASTETTGAA